MEVLGLVAAGSPDFTGRIQVVQTDYKEVLHLRVDVIVTTAVKFQRHPGLILKFQVIRYDVRCILINAVAAISRKREIRQQQRTSNLQFTSRFFRIRVQFVVPAVQPIDNIREDACTRATKNRAEYIDPCIRQIVKELLLQLLHKAIVTDLARSRVESICHKFVCHIVEDRTADIRMATEAFVQLHILFCRSVKRIQHALQTSISMTIIEVFQSQTGQLRDLRNIYSIDTRILAEHGIRKVPFNQYQLRQTQMLLVLIRDIVHQLIEVIVSLHQLLALIRRVTLAIHIHEKDIVGTFRQTTSCRQIDQASDTHCARTACSNDIVFHALSPF